MESNSILRRAEKVKASNRRFLIPARANTCWEMVSATTDDATPHMRVSQQASKKCPASPNFWNARAIRTIGAVNSNEFC